MPKDLSDATVPIQDVVIVGGGPAGSAAGLSLLRREGIRVTLLEATDYEDPRVGESLSPGVRPLLEYLGVWQRFEREQRLQSFGSRAAWGSAEAQSLDFLFTVHGAGWSLDRVALDRMLADVFAERGGRLVTATRFLGCERADHGWTVRTRTGGGQVEEIACRYLIDASGRRGVVAQHLGVIRAKHDDLVGVARFGAIPSSRAPELHVMVEACEYGWWYTAPVPGQGLSTVLMMDIDCARRLRAARADAWSDLLKETTLTRERASGVQFSGQPRVFQASSTMLKSVGGDGWVAVGDAAASHDPLSSSGIPHAMGTGTQGAVVAADALFAEGGALQAYQEAVQEDFHRYLQTHWRYYQLEARWQEARFWRRRRTAVTIDPDAVLPSLNHGTEVGGGNADARSDLDTTSQSTVHLPQRLAKELAQSIRSDRTAHRIVRGFAEEHPEVSDQRIILGLQELASAARDSRPGVHQ